MATLKFLTDFDYELERGKTVSYKAGHTYRDVPEHLAISALSKGVAVEVDLKESVENGPWYEDRELST